MKRHLLYLIIVLSTGIYGCKNTQTRVNEFVTEYNKQTLNIDNHILKRTYAENIIKKTTDDIKIVLVLNIEDTDEKVEVYKKMFPSFIADLLKNNSATKKLLNEGVKFEVVFCDIDRNVIKKETLDQNRINESYKDIEPTKSINKTPENNLPKELNRILAILNKNLPIENKAEGTTIVKIDVNEKNELVYEYEVNKQVQLLFKSKGFVELAKDALLRQDNFKLLARQIEKYGIRKFRILYKDSDQKLLNEVLITEKDL